MCVQYVSPPGGVLRCAGTLPGSDEKRSSYRDDTLPESLTFTIFLNGSAQTRDFESRGADNPYYVGHTARAGGRWGRRWGTVAHRVPPSWPPPGGWRRSPIGAPRCRSRVALCCPSSEDRGGVQWAPRAKDLLRSNTVGWGRADEEAREETRGERGEEREERARAGDRARNEREFGALTGETRRADLAEGGQIGAAGWVNITNSRLSTVELNCTRNRGGGAVGLAGSWICRAPVGCKLGLLSRRARTRAMRSAAAADPAGKLQQYGSRKSLDQFFFEHIRPFGLTATRWK